MTTTKTTTTSKSPATDKDAVALLKADHAAVSHLFAEYEKTRSAARKAVLLAAAAA